MKLSETIKQYRTAKNLTQEQLGSLLGVSAQAVSKWETSDTYPDGSLLVPLANALGVSLDTLFDNGKHDLFAALSEVAEAARACSERDSFLYAWNVGWQLEHGMFGEQVTVRQEDLRVGEHAFDVNHSTIDRDGGFTHIAGGDAPFYAVFCEPEKGWADAVGDGEALRRKFEALGDRDVMTAVLYLYRQTSGYLFDGAHLAAACGIAEERIGNVLEKLMLLAAVSPVPIDIDGETRMLYQSDPRHFLLMTLLTAREIEPAGSWHLQAENRTEPYLK